MNSINKNALMALEELTDNELDQVLGAAGGGVVPTVSRDCHMNSWQWLFTCCLTL